MSITVENLSKYYGSQAAVNNINFTINSGEIVGFLGPNGAGKSTTMKMITTYLTPTSGRITVNGLDTQEKALDVRSKIGYLPEQNPLYLDMNVVDYLGYAAELQGVEKKDLKSSIKKMIEVCGLGDMQTKDIGQLSKGYRQRVGLAQAMIHDPEVLILDEPTSGLDPNQILEIRKLIRSLGKEKTLILSTHILQEVRAVCDRVLIINKGNIVADGTADSLQQRFEGNAVVKLAVRKNTADNNENIRKSLESVKGVSKVRLGTVNGDEVQLEVDADKGADIREDLFRKIVSMNLIILDMHREHSSLEDIFRQLTT